MLIEEKEPGRVYLTRYSGKQPTGEVSAYGLDIDVGLSVLKSEIERFRTNGNKEAQG